MTWSPALRQLRKATFSRAFADGAKSKAAKNAKKVEEVQIDVLPVKYPDRSRRSSVVGRMCSDAPLSGGSYYITTAGSSPDRGPHMGHAYEAVLADICARFQRLAGKSVVLQTGTDEHGEKVARAANRANMTPMQLCNRYSVDVQCLQERLSVASGAFERTTSSAHQSAAAELWHHCFANGDIYLGRFKGWYSMREERFMTDDEALETGFIDAFTGEPLARMETESFFFRLSRYRDKIIDLIEKTVFLHPERSREKVLKRLTRTQLHDIPISWRDSSWGIPCPGEPRVMHVAFESLARYTLGARALDAAGLDPTDQTTWRADVHVVGDDMVWLHAVVLPGLLMSAGMSMPKHVWAHGHVLGVDGRRMMISLGNTMDPHDLLDSAPSDTLRWYFARMGGEEFQFCPATMKAMHDTDLRNLSNLVHRAMVLSARFCKGRLPDADGDGLCPFDVVSLRSTVEESMQQFQVARAAQALVDATIRTDDWLTELVVGGRLKKMDKARQQAVVRVLIEAVFILAHLYAAFIPSAADAIISKIGSQTRSLCHFSSFSNLEPGCAASSKSALFKPLELLEEAQGVEHTKTVLSSAPSGADAMQMEPEDYPASRSLPDELDLYLADTWAPGIFVRPATDESLGDHQMVDERDEYKNLLTRVAPGEQCLDIGGHIGTLTVALSEAAAGVRVVAVEPDPDSVAVLRRNLQWRGLDRVVLLHGALRARADSCTTKLYRAPHNASINSCVPVHGRDAIKVPVVTVAELVHACASPPTVAKMDIEGGEYEVLPLLLAMCPELRLLSLELHFTKQVFKAHLAPALAGLLELFGFRALDGMRDVRQGVAQLTLWERVPGAERVTPDMVPSLLTLWRHTHAGCTERLAERAGLVRSE